MKLITVSKGILLFALLAAVLASACTSAKTTGAPVKEETTQNEVVTAENEMVNETNSTVTASSPVGESTQSSTTPGSSPTPSSTRSSSTTEPVHQGDSNIVLSRYEGPNNATIKFSASSGFGNSETVEVSMSGLSYTAATFWSTDGTVYPSDLYIPKVDSSGNELQGTIEIRARGTTSGSEYRTYYTVSATATQ